MNLDKNLKVSNIVVSGILEGEVDYEAMDTIDRDGWRIEYKDIIPLGVELEYQDYPQVNLHDTGGYIIRSGSRKELEKTNKKFVKLMVDIGIIDSVYDAEFEVKNIVGTLTLDEDINLQSLHSKYPIQSQYNPEEFTAVTFKPEDEWYSANVFQTGKIVLTGCESVDELEEAAEHIYKCVESEFISSADSNNPLL